MTGLTNTHTSYYIWISLQNNLIWTQKRSVRCVGTVRSKTKIKFPAIWWNCAIKSSMCGLNWRLIIKSSGGVTRYKFFHDLSRYWLFVCRVTVHVCLWDWWTICLLPINSKLLHLLYTTIIFISRILMAYQFIYINKFWADNFKISNILMSYSYNTEI